MAALEVKDEVTREHVIRVGELAMRAGERGRIDPVTLRAVGLGALLHDVGKLLTPDEVLLKPGALTSEERATIERHPPDGAQLISGFPHLAAAARIVRAHHERPDGTGYPDGLTSDTMPAGASIVSVVDAWDAMVSDRPYRHGMPAERAQAILRAGAGTQWQSAAVDLVCAEVRDRGPAHASHLDRVGRIGLGQEGTRLGDPLAACLPELASLSHGA